MKSGDAYESVDWAFRILKVKDKLFSGRCPYAVDARDSKTLGWASLMFLIRITLPLDA